MITDEQKRKLREEEEERQKKKKAQESDSMNTMSPSNPIYQVPYVDTSPSPSNDCGSSSSFDSGSSSGGCDSGSF